MKLFIYDHCPFCVKAHMIFGLKKQPVEIVYIDEDDVETPTQMIGKKMVPILQKADGSCLPESMDIVHYIDQLDGKPMISADSNPKIDAWIKAYWRPSLDLFIPRFVDADFPELETESARANYRQRETEAFGDLPALIAKTPELAPAMNEGLQQLDALLSDGEFVNATLSEADFHLFAILRSLSIVKALDYPPKVSAYTQQMAARTNIGLLFNQAV